MENSCSFCGWEDLNLGTDVCCSLLAPVLTQGEGRWGGSGHLWVLAAPRRQSVMRLHFTRGQASNSAGKLEILDVWHFLSVSPHWCGLFRRHWKNILNDRVMHLARINKQDKPLGTTAEPLFKGSDPPGAPTSPLRSRMECPALPCPALPCSTLLFWAVCSLLHCTCSGQG